MALIKCRECGAEISSTAKRCPQCGAADPDKTTHLITVVSGSVLLILLVLLAIRWLTTPGS